MSFVPGFDYDVFVSYAQINNKEGWVDRFQEKLTIWLNERLGRDDSARFFFDTSTIRGHEALTPKIETALRSCATLVLVLSEGYLESPWCQQELTLFSQLVRESPGRIFLVQYEKVDIQRKPVPIRELIGYTLFREQSRDNTLPLKPQDPEFERQLNALRFDLAKTLKDLKTPPAAAVREGSSRPTVYLAEVPESLSRAYREMEMYLAQSGYDVRPGRYFHYAPPGYAAAVDDHLENSNAFVQLLGAEPIDVKQRPEFPAGYESWLLNRASERKLPILSWRSCELSPSAIASESHRQVVFGPHVTACDFEEFKPIVQNAVAQRKLSRQLQEQLPAAAEAVHSLLVKATGVDAQFITAIMDERFRDDPNIGYFVVEDEQTLVEVADVIPCDGVIIVYGASPPKWVQGRILEFMQLMKRPSPPTCAVFFVPPDDDSKRLGAKPPKLRFLKHTEPQALAEFVQSLQGVVA